MHRLLYPMLALMAFSPTAAIAEQGQPQDADALFRHAFSEACSFDDEFSPASYYPNESWELSWQEEYSDSESSGTLHQFFCSAGAYNVNFVYYFEDSFYGVLPVAFAVPQYDVKYENDDFDGAVEAITLRGFSTQFILTNAEFDPVRREIVNNSKWRGLGDASSGGRWVFDRGRFVLKFFDVDASYDGEMNPERIVEYK